MIKLQAPKYKLLAEGEYSATFVDVDELGEVEGRYGTTCKVRVILQIDDPSSASQDNPTVRRDFPLSNARNSVLVKFIEALFARELTDEERLDFDVESIIGTPCKVTIVHNTDDQDRTWANIDGVKPYPRDLKPMHLTPWVRLKDRATSGKLVSQPRPRMKTAAETKAAAKAEADFVHEADMPPSNPTTTEEPPVAVGGGEYTAGDEDIPF